ncbi:hypothetical protein AB6C82_22620 [Vibrio splendidus]
MSTPETKRLCLRVWNRSSSGGTRPTSNQFYSFYTAASLTFQSRKHSALNGVHLIRIDDAVYVDCLKWNIAKGICFVVSDNEEHEAFDIDNNNERNFKFIGRYSPIFDVLR